MERRVDQHECSDRARPRIGLQRDESTAIASQYYSKLPRNLQNSVVLMIDPMLATGGSAIAAVSFLQKAGVKNMKFVCLVAAPEGISALHRQHPEVPIYCAAIDRQLNDKGYILPGLGDAGDRIFGT